MAQKQPPKIPSDYHSLDILTIENHIRDLVKDQLSPLYNLHKVDSDEIRRVESKLDQLGAQVKDVMEIYFQGDGKEGMMDKFYEELSRVERMAVADNKLMEGRWVSMGHELKHAKIQAEESTGRVTKCESVLDNVIEGIRDRANKQKTWQEDFVTKWERRAWQQSDTSEQQLKRIEDVETKMTECRQMLDVTVKRQTIVKEKQAGQRGELDTIIKKLFDLENDTVKQTQFKEEMARLDAKMEDFRQNLVKAQNQFQMIENFVEKYQPIRIQSLIGETLLNVLNVTELEKLKVYERSIIAKMHEVVLEDNGVPDLREVQEDIARTLTEKAVQTEQTEAADESITYAGQDSVISNVATKRKTKSSIRITATAGDEMEETNTFQPFDIDLAVQKSLIKFQIGLGDVYQVLQQQKSVVDSQLTEQRAYLSTLHQEIITMFSKKQQSNKQVTEKIGMLDQAVLNHGNVLLWMTEAIGMLNLRGTSRPGQMSSMLPTTKQSFLERTDPTQSAKRLTNKESTDNVYQTIHRSRNESRRAGSTSGSRQRRNDNSDLNPVQGLMIQARTVLETDRSMLSLGKVQIPIAGQHIKDLSASELISPHEMNPNNQGRGSVGLMTGPRVPFPSLSQNRSQNSNGTLPKLNSKNQGSQQLPT